MLACLLLSGDIETNPGPAIRVFSQNVRSLKNKLCVLRSHAGELADYSALCLTETWLAPHVGDSELQLGLPDFAWYRRDRDENGGGVACAVKAALSPIHRPDLETDCECLVIQLGVTRPALLAVCYRPPDADQQVEKVADLLRGLYRSGRPYLLVGDLNLPEISWHRDGEAVLRRRTARAITFTDALTEVDAQQSVVSATRGENFLDLAISSGGTAVSNVREKLFDSDHLVVDTYIFLDIGVIPRPSRSKAYNYKRADFAALRRALRSVPWDVLEQTDVDSAVDLFYDFTFNIVNDYVPMVNLRQKFPPWFDGSVRQLLRIKERAHTLKKANPSPENVALHARARSEFKAQADKSYQNYLLGLTRDFRQNSKRFWTFVKSLKSSTRVSPALEYNGRVIRDDVERANSFNECFVKKFSDPRVDDYPDAIDLGAPGISVFDVPTGRVAQLLRQISPYKACGPDGLSARILHECADELAVPLDIICRLSVRSGVFPSVWKQANVVPVHKKGPKKFPENYRPVSLLAISSKILEKVICESMLRACLPALPPSQHGFIPKRSCASNLACFLDHCWTSLSKGSQTDVIYTDFSSAFTSVNHKLLLHKLCHSFNISGLAYSWIQSYLSNRSQRVVLDGKYSDWLPVLSGVPEGSILGPILFSCYVADLPNNISNACLSYADDVKIFNRINNRDDANSLQADINRLCSWSKSWRLKLNPKKCKAMTFTLRSSPVLFPYYLDGHQLERCSQMRDLGVVLDSKLTFAHHVDEVVKKANRMLGLLIRSMQTAPCMRGSKFDPSPVLAAYYANVRSIIEYGSVLWSGAADSHLVRLERLQHRFLMWMAGRTQVRCPPMDYSSLLKHFSCPSIKARFIQNDLTFMRAVFCGKLDCIQLVSMFSLSVPTRRSRHTGLFHVPLGRVNTIQRCLLRRLPETTNEFASACPDEGFFNPSAFVKSRVRHFCNKKGTYGT